MEIVEGGDLENWLEENDPKNRDLDQVVGFFMQMVDVILFLTSI